MLYYIASRFAHQLQEPWIRASGKVEARWGRGFSALARRLACINEEIEPGSARSLACAVIIASVFGKRRERTKRTGYNRWCNSQRAFGALLIRRNFLRLAAALYTRARALRVFLNAIAMFAQPTRAVARREFPWRARRTERTPHPVSPLRAFAAAAHDIRSVAGIFIRRF